MKPAEHITRTSITTEVQAIKVLPLHPDLLTRVEAVEAGLRVLEEREPSLLAKAFQETCADLKRHKAKVSELQAQVESLEITNRQQAERIAAFEEAEKARLLLKEARRQNQLARRCGVS